MAYYTLCSLDIARGSWCPEFGDYDRETVEAELEEYRANGFLKSHLKIVTTKTARQSDIDKALGR